MKPYIWSSLLAALTCHNMLLINKLHIAFERQAIVRGNIFMPFAV